LENKKHCRYGKDLGKNASYAVGIRFFTYQDRRLKTHRKRKKEAANCQKSKRGEKSENEEEGEVVPKTGEKGGVA